MIRREDVLLAMRRALRRSRIVALLGPRQCGKTTIARTVVSPGSENYFDLEEPGDRARLSEPMTALRSLRGTVVIDEVQREPRLFEILRVLADRRPLPARFLILGSASPALVRGAAESLAGRVETVAMSGLGLLDVGASRWDRLWLRGGFPLSFLAKSEADSVAWRRNYAQAVIERDVPRLGYEIPSAALMRFWTMLAHWHGQIWNAAEPARSLGVSEPTVRRYLDLLDGMFMVRQLQPWHANLNKRQVKSPKVYFRDTGVLHQLLGIRTTRELFSHPKCGASWEGLVIDEALRVCSPDEAYFWATHGGAELDLLMIRAGRRVGIECKRTDSPTVTPSMRIAMRDLGLDRIIVVHSGEKSYSLSRNITAVPLSGLSSALI